MTQAFEDWANRLREHFEEVATVALQARSTHVEPLYEAMRYSVLGGGKRVRALLTYAAAELTQAPLAYADEAAMAVEFVHAYSLIHDDMPCMDNDTLRRGKPTCHVKFGEAQAMLAGDALQPEAFRRITQLPLDPNQVVRIVAELAYASGPQGMCGGQFIDLSSVGEKLDLSTLSEMHRMKTGALIRASVRMGALCGKAELIELFGADLTSYADRLGLAFQVVDDILDVTADTATLGKTAGKDEDNNKPTFVSILGLEKAQLLAQGCAKEAYACIERMQATQKAPHGATTRLKEMADFIINRKS